MITRPLWYEPRSPKVKYNLSNNVCIDPWVTSQLPSIHAHDLGSYPEEYLIYQSISKHHRVHPRNVTIGYGLGEIIQRIYSHLDLRTLTVVSPTWSMASGYAEIERLQYIEVKYQNFNQMNFEDLVTSATHSIYVANPNGINSHMLTRDQIIRLTEKYMWVIVDESYMDFANINNSVIDHSLELDNLIVLKTLSKSVALPGIRLGYAISSYSTTNLLQHCRPSCTSHSTTLQIADTAFSLIDTHIERMKQTRRIIEQTYDTIPSDGNYVLFRGKPPIKHDVLTKEVYPGIVRMSLFAPELINDIMI